MVAAHMAKLLATQMPMISNVNDPTISLIKELRVKRRTETVTSSSGPIGGWRDEIVHKH